MGSLKEGEWSCYKDGQFNEGSMVMLLIWPINGENRHSTKVANFNGGRMVILRRC